MENCFSPTKHARTFSRRSRKHILATTVLAGLVLCAPAAYAGPEDGKITGGQASISSSGTETLIQQSTDKAIIDWRKFDVGKDEGVHFQQPSSSSITLNRVRGGQSQIDGRVTANGNIIIANPDGVVFGKGSQVDVSGLVATTADIDNDAFMNGNGSLNFNTAGNAHGKVINQGRITVKEAGLVGLVAPHVENSGVIEARMGTVTLAGAQQMTVDFAGDGLISFAAGVDAPGASHEVHNSGLIKADGGSVLLTAQDARGIVNQLVDNSGTVEALSVGQKNGKIVLEAPRTSDNPHDSVAMNSGRLDASGNGAGKKGGHIEILADKVGVLDGSAIDVSGAQGGGKVRIGGDYQGGGTLQRSKLTVVEQDTVIEASALSNGKGGDVVVWSDGDTIYNGQINAKGGAETGDGGDVEVSGKRALNFKGSVNTRATNGAHGTLLLDPTNITIADVASDQNVANPSWLVYQPSADDAVSIMDIDTIYGLLYGSGAVTIQTRATGSQEGDIIWDTSSYYNCYGDCASQTVTLDAHDDVIFNQSPTGELYINAIAGDEVVLNAPFLLSLNVSAKNTASDIYVGDDGPGFNISSASLANMQGSLGVGQSTHTGDIYIQGDRTWTSYLGLVTQGDVIIDDDQHFQAGGLTVQAGDLDLPGNITTAGSSLGLYSISNGDMGFGDAYGSSFHLTSAEWEDLSGWGNYSIYSGGDVRMEGKTRGGWYVTAGDDLEIDGDIVSTSGNVTLGGDSVTINGDLNSASTVSLSASSLNFTGNISGQGYFNLYTTNAAGIGLGDSTGGAVHLTSAQFAGLSGFDSYYFNAGATGPISMEAKDWDGSLQVQSAALNILGDQSLDGGDYFYIYTDDLNLAGDLSGTGNLLINSLAGGVNLGLGDGAAGNFVMSDADLDHIADGWEQISFGYFNNVDMRARTWNDDVDIYSFGAATIEAQDFGDNDFNFTTGTINLTGNLSGSGTLTFDPNTSIGLAGQAGTFNLDTNELDRIVDGWSDIIIGDQAGGTTTNFLVGAYDWRDNVTFRNGGSNSTMRIQGAQNMGANNLTIQSGGLIDLNAAVAGTGTLTLQQRTNSTMAFGNTGGTVNTRISSADVNSYIIGQGWNNIVIGSENSLGSLTVTGSYNWNTNVLFQSRGNSLSMSAGTHNFGDNDLTIRAYNNLSLGGTLTGTGDLTLEGITDDRTMILGTNTGANLAIDDTELTRLTDGWDRIVIGRDTGGAVSVDSAIFNDNVEIHSGTGIQFTGASDFGANDLTLYTNTITNGGTVAGTGDLLFQRTTPGTYRIGDAAYLDASEIESFQDGWDSMTFGDANSSDSFVFTNDVSFNDPARFLTNTGNITLNGTVSSTAGPGSALTFATPNGQFNNNAGADAIDPGAGRYLIYLDALNGNSLGGLAPNRVRFNRTYSGYSPSNVQESGNLLFFSEAANSIVPEQIQRIQAFSPTESRPEISDFVTGTFEVPSSLEIIGLDTQDYYYGITYFQPMANSDEDEES